MSWLPLPPINSAKENEQLHVALGLVYDEALRAQEKFGPMASMHEGLGVLLEEFQELTEAVRLRQTVPVRGERIRAEAIQVAAVALRMAEQAVGITR